MRFRLQETSDGSVTVFDAEAGECFKSRHAAHTESEFVFFRPGVLENPWYRKEKPFRILELGFGLGTNFLFLADQQLEIEFLSIERDLAGAKFFLQHREDNRLKTLVEEKKFKENSFSASLLEADFFAALPHLETKGEKFHCIYFDPFSPKANPDAWTDRLFAHSANLLAPGGRLVTYSVSRAAKDSAANAGLIIEKRELPKELQKRQALLASKPGPH